MKAKYFNDIILKIKYMLQGILKGYKMEKISQIIALASAMSNLKNIEPIRRANDRSSECKLHRKTANKAKKNKGKSAKTSKRKNR